jgi:hypothetical protein
MIGNLAALGEEDLQGNMRVVGVAVTLEGVVGHFGHVIVETRKLGVVEDLMQLLVSRHQQSQIQVTGI